jgi:dihydrolipoamide dehydrogenase
MEPFDLLVVGGGPGGYVAAIRGAQLGLKVACIDEHRQLGGTCLRVGCIPSKALLESSERYAEARFDLKKHGVVVGSVDLDLATMLKRKSEIVASLTGGIDGLLKKHKITRLLGRGRLLGEGRVRISNGEKENEIAARHIVLALGSRPAAISGLDVDQEFICGSDDALSWPAVPRRLVVVGAGYIGLELGSVWSRLGSEVTVVEALDRILPGMDREIADAAKAIFERQGLKFRLSSKVESASKATGELKLSGGETIACDRLLVAIGRRPNTADAGLDAAGVSLDPQGRVTVDEHFRTSAKGVYAIGDCIAGPMLAHKASEEGVACVEQIVTGYGHVNYDAIPGVVYTHPEIASVGKTEQDLQRSQTEYRVGKFAFRANGRARALGQTDGFVKMLAHRQTDRLLGVHILGPRAGDLIAEAAVAIDFGASSEDLARSCHAHPTLAEALHEAALDVDGRMLHS